MKRIALLTIAFLALTGCKKDAKETPGTRDSITGSADNTTAAPLAFATKSYNKKSTLPCDGVCTYVDIQVPEATGAGVASDSINKAVFNVVRSIVHFGENPSSAKSYEEAMASFIKAYDDYKKKWPKDDMAWERKIKGTIDYQSDNILNIKLNYYTFDGGAHGYSGDRSLIFDPQTGKKLKSSDIFKDQKAFTAFAEKKFREKYKIPAGKSINSTGFMFLEEKFKLPEEGVYFRENGLLLQYNTMEIASNAEGKKDLLIPYTELDPYLKMK